MNIQDKDREAQRMHTFIKNYHKMTPHMIVQYNALYKKDGWEIKENYTEQELFEYVRDLPDKMLRCLIRKIVKYDKEPISETLYTIYGEKIIPYVYEELYLEAFDKNINIDHWMMLVCLSEVYDSMLMWSHYAQNHRFGLTFILARR